MFGYEPGAIEITHASFFEHIHPDDREAKRAASLPAIQRGEPFEKEFRIVRRDGAVRTVHTWTDFECDANGKPIRMIGTCQDVTERKRAELDLREADRRKDEFLAMLSHELRNPLAPILNALEILGARGPAQPEVRSTLPAVIEQAGRSTWSGCSTTCSTSRASARARSSCASEPVELAAMLVQRGRRSAAR